MHIYIPVTDLINPSERVSRSKAGVIIQGSEEMDIGRFECGQGQNAGARMHESGHFTYLTYLSDEKIRVTHARKVLQEMKWR